MCFVMSAKRVPEPIFPLHLIVHYDLATNYLIVVLQIMVQMSLMMSVPLYFQATQNASRRTPDSHGIEVRGGGGGRKDGRGSGQVKRQTGAWDAQPAVSMHVRGSTAMFEV